MLFLLGLMKFKLKQEKCLFVIVLFAASFCAMFIAPKTIYDIARHYETILTIKSSSMDFIDYIFNSFLITDFNYQFTYSFNAMNYIIAKYLPVNTLPFIAFSLCYGVFGYILFDIKKRNDFNNLYVALSFFLMNCLLPILYIYSNVRNPIAAAVMALAVYLKLYKELKLFNFLLLVTIAVTMHPMVAVALPFLFLAKFKFDPKGLFLFVPYIVFLPLIMEMFQTSENLVLRYVGYKYYSYTVLHEFSQGLFFYVTPLTIVFLVLVLTFIQTTNDKRKEDSFFVNFFQWYCMFILANVHTIQFVLRLPWIIGPLAPLIINLLLSVKFKSSNHKFVLNFFIISMLLIWGILSLYINYAWLV